MLERRVVKLVLLVTFVVVSLFGTPAAVNADDRKHVALLDFEGPRSASVRGDVMRLAATRCWIASPSKLDGRSVREFAVDHDIDLVIAGAIEKRGHEYQIRIRFLRGTTGRPIGGATATVRQPAMDRVTKRRVERELVRALATIPPRPSEAVDAPEGLTRSYVAP